MTIFSILTNSGIKITSEDCSQLGMLVRAHFGARKFPKIAHVESWGNKKREMKVRDYPDDCTEAIEGIIVEYFKSKTDKK